MLWRAAVNFNDEQNNKEEGCVITIPGIWKNPGDVYPIFWDIHIPGLFDDLVITNSGILKNHGMYFLLIFGMNSLMLHCI